MNKIWRFLRRCWNLSLKWPCSSLTLSMFTVSILTFLSKNAPRGCLIVNKLSTCINIMHSFSFFCCVPHTFISLYLESVVSTRSLLSFMEDEMFRDPTISFLLPSYAKAQALALESLASLPSWIVSWGYHPRVRAFIDDEALEDV